MTVYGYEQVESQLTEYSWNENKKISTDKKLCNYGLYSLLIELDFDVIDQSHKISLLKCRKNEVQQEGMR